MNELTRHVILLISCESSVSARIIPLLVTRVGVCHLRMDTLSRPGRGGVRTQKGGFSAVATLFSVIHHCVPERKSHLTSNSIEKSLNSLVLNNYCSMNFFQKMLKEN